MYQSRSIDNKKLINDWLSIRNYYSESILCNELRIREIGEKNALLLFKQASKNVPAYKHFLKKHNINSKSVRSISDLAKVPPTTKENYITKYSIRDRCWFGNHLNSDMISTSSGTTGKPNYWPRDLLTEINGAYQHEFVLKNILLIDRQKTLFINGFAMGNWIAGTFTQACIRLLSLKKYLITMMTPGYDSSAIFEILRDLSSFYDQIIITGHTPFLKELVDQAPEEKINLKELNLVFLGTGQGITEDWRKYIIGKLGSKDFYHTFINLYGSADAELMGFETPASIYIRKNASKYTKKQKKNFRQNRLPSIYQYDPRITYFEECSGELLITKYSISPLIRYNIHDEGGVFSWDDMLKSFNIKNIGVLLENNLKYKTAKFPFVYIFGRDKFMVKIYGANVFTEHVQSVFDNAKLRDLFTGRFKMEINYNYINNPVMICHAELNSRVKIGNSEYKKLLKSTFVKEVARLNSEYKFVLNRMGRKVIPEIKLYRYGDESIFPKNITRKTA